MRLEKLAEEMGPAIEISWRSFMLRPEPRDLTLEKFRAYTESWRRPAAMEPEAKFRVWATENPPPSHSVPALIASKAVEDVAGESWDTFHHSLMEAYFVENRTVSDLEVQLDVAAAVGIDAELVRGAIADNVERYVVDIFSEHNEAVQSGVTGVPAVVMPGGFVIPGAQDVATYRNIVEKFLEQADSSVANNP